MEQTEQWKDIPGYEGHYQISNLVRVKSLARKKRGPGNSVQFLPERILKPCWMGRYLCVVLNKNAKGKTYPIHCLAGRAFIPNPEGKPELNHIDGKRYNNSLSNLEWATRRENALHAIRIGLGAVGIRNGQTNFSEEDVWNIIKRLDNGEKQEDIARDYKVSRGTIGHIKSGRNWKHLTGRNPPLTRNSDMAMNRREKEKKTRRYNDAKQRAEKHDKGFEPTAFKVPEGMKVFRFRKAKIYHLDFLPYTCSKGEDEPGGNPFCDEGFDHYERTYYIHYVPTPEGGRSYCCLVKTFKEKRCPVCDFQAELRRKGADSKTIDSFDWKEQQLFNVIDLDEKENGVQLFSFNWWQLGKLLDAKSKLKEKYAKFYHLSGGRTAEIQLEEGTFNGRTTFRPIAVDFEEREDYDEDVMEKVADLDACPIKMDYDELKEILEQGGPTTPEKLRKAAEAVNGKKSSDEDEDDSDDDDEKDTTAEDLGIEKGSKVRHKKFGICTVTHVSPDGTSLKLKDEEDEVHSACDPAECKVLDDDSDEDDSDDEDEKPAKKKTAKKSSEDEEEEEDSDDEDPDDDEDDSDDDDDLDALDEDEEDEDEKPVKKKPAKKKASEDDDDSDEDDSEDEDEPAPKKKKVGRR